MVIRYNIKQSLKFLNGCSSRIFKACFNCGLPDLWQGPRPFSWQDAGRPCVTWWKTLVISAVWSGERWGVYQGVSGCTVSGSLSLFTATVWPYDHQLRKVNNSEYFEFYLTHCFDWLIILGFTPYRQYSSHVIAALFWYGDMNNMYIQSQLKLISDWLSKLHQK